MFTIKYPEIEVALTGMDGNAFSVLAAVSGALRRAGIDQAERDTFHDEATSSDYDYLLQTAMRWVTVS